MGNFYRSIRLWLVPLALMSCLEAGSAEAVEGLAATGPIGGTDIRVALMPPPGLYGVGVGIGFPLGDLSLPSQTLPASGFGFNGGIGLLNVYDAKFLGGTLASSVFAGYQDLCFGLKGTGKKPCSAGAMDVYSDLMLWNFFIPDEHTTASQETVFPIAYGLGIQAGFGVNFPTGAYDAKDSVHVGSNVFDLAPNFSFTYTVPSILGPGLGQATEFSGRASFNYYTENPDTNYQSGAIAALDFAVTQRWGNWQFGATGTAWTQVADDKIEGNRVGSDGRRASTVLLGPLISYDFLAGGKPWNLTFKAVFPVDVEYVPAPTVMMIRLGTKLF